MVVADEILFDCSMRITRGDNFRPSLLDLDSQQFRTKSDRYRRLVSLHSTTFSPACFEGLVSHHVFDNNDLTWAFIIGLQIDSVYKASPLSASFRRCSVERFTNGSLIVHFRLYFDRRKIPA